METPKNLEEMDSYYDRILSLLEKWNWIYSDRSTDLLLSDVLDCKYLDFLESLDYDLLNQLPLGYTEGNFPPDLQYFIKECAELSYVLPCTSDEISLRVPIKLKKRTSSKKKYEIERLAGYVLKHCKEQKITTVCDIGSGLGYIDRMLTLIGDVKVTGIEYDNNKITRAVKLNKELLEPEKSEKINYIHQKLETNTLANVCKQIEMCCESKSCLIGLHACGDLSVVTLRLFLNVSKIKSLILMPCCYHRMADINSFPASNLLGKKLSNERGKLVNTTFLRTASESTKERWCEQTVEAHEAHAFSVLARAVIELYLTESKYKARRTGRKCVTRQHNQDWTKYVEIWLDRHQVTCQQNIEISKRKLLTELNSTWEKYQHLIKRIEAYTSLQVCLQSTAEHLLIADKLTFLLENGCETVTAIRITNPARSPRCIAIVANK